MTEPPGRQASTSRAPAMCKPGHSPASAPDSQDSQSDPDLAVPSRMYGHLVVDIVTLCLIVVVALLYLVCSFWQKRKAAKAAREAEEAALAAAASKVHSEATQTELPLFFGLDDAVNRLHQQLTSHQHRLDSMEAQRLQWSISTDLCPSFPSRGQTFPRWTRTSRTLRTSPTALETSSGT